MGTLQSLKAFFGMVPADEYDGYDLDDLDDADYRSGYRRPEYLADEDDYDPYPEPRRALPGRRARADTDGIPEGADRDAPPDELRRGTDHRRALPRRYAGDHEPHRAGRRGRAQARGLRGGSGLRDAGLDGQGHQQGVLDLTAEPGPHRGGQTPDCGGRVAQPDLIDGRVDTWTPSGLSCTGYCSSSGCS